MSGTRTDVPGVDSADTTNPLGVAETLDARRGKPDATAPDARAPSDGLPVAQVSELPIVDRAKYIVEGEFARGGLGRILRAREVATGRAIAIKEVLDGTPDAAGRFLREALVTANLQHPAVVPIYEVGRWPSGEPFYAMKLVVGRSLDDVIRDATSQGTRLALLPHIMHVADAMAYAHEERIIHRDLKPANILVGAFGETVVIDWGLAKDLRAEDAPTLRRKPSDGSAVETVAGAVMGTPAYMAPEQARGDEADERADVYALGAMLYHVLSGRRPYADALSVDEVLERVIAGPPPPLTELVPSVPRDLAALVAKAMQRERANRYPSAKQLAEDLRRFQAGQLVGAHQYSRAMLFRRWLRRHRAPIAVGTVMALLLVVMGVLGVRRILAERDDARTQRAVAEAERREADRQRDGSEVERAEAERQRAEAERERAAAAAAEKELARLQADNEQISRERDQIVAEYRDADTKQRQELDRRLASLNARNAANEEALRHQDGTSPVPAAATAAAAQSKPCAVKLCPKAKPLCSDDERVCSDANCDDAGCAIDPTQPCCQERERLPAALTEDDIRYGIWPVRGRVAICNDLYSQPGTVVVSFQVDGAGAVSGAKVVGELAGTPTATCVEAAMQTARFRRWKGPSVTVKYPFYFR